MNARKGVYIIGDNPSYENKLKSYNIGDVFEIDGELNEHNCFKVFDTLLESFILNKPNCNFYEVKAYEEAYRIRGVYVIARKIKIIRKITQDEILKEIQLNYSSDNWRIRYGIASSVYTPRNILSILAKDKDYHIRQNVGKNINTPYEILKELLNDNFWGVIEETVKNKNLKVKDLVNVIINKRGWSSIVNNAKENLLSRDRSFMTNEELFELVKVMSCQLIK